VGARPTARGPPSRWAENENRKVRAMGSLHIPRPAWPRRVRPRGWGRSSLAVLAVGVLAALALVGSVQHAAQASTGTPYGGTAAAVPGTVYAANYDTGGQGVAYNVTSTNGSANSYRSDGVDLETTTHRPPPRPATATTSAGPPAGSGSTTPSTSPPRAPTPSASALPRPTASPTRCTSTTPPAPTCPARSPSPTPAATRPGPRSTPPSRCRPASRR
jgi:hypothetical protein